MSPQKYNFWSRLLHRMALGNRFVAEASLDIDRLMFPPQAAADVAGAPVFVTGLARAGTTILMRQLHATGAFRSLTYRDMPFVLAPNLGARLSGVSRKDMAAEERAHGDGILVDFDSPEALEEVFWRIQAGEAYIFEDRLRPMQGSAELEQAFRDYIASLLRAHEGKRYLSKNNNNILRLPTIVQSFPDAVVILPFRAPLDHAASLMRQHRSFLERHAEDAFSLAYMNWLVHHEFGQAHKPFVFGSWTPAEGLARDPKTDLPYWLQLWHDTYSYLERTAPPGCVFLSYEGLCDEVDTVWPRLCAALDLPVQAPADRLQRVRHQAEHEVPAALLADCTALYDRLRAREVWREV